MADRWTVRWCYEIPVDDAGDSDHDRAKYRTRSFDSDGEAMAFAKQQAPDAVYGYCTVLRARPVSRSAAM